MPKAKIVQRAWCVYVHYRPDGSPFYVGKALLYANRMKCRPYNLTLARNQVHKRIVAKYGAENITVSVALVDDEQAAFAKEIALIAQFKGDGHFLANLTIGGEGPSGFKHHEETKMKLSSRRKAYFADPENRAKACATHVGMTGRVHSETTKATMRAAQRARYAKPGERERQREVVRVANRTRSSSGPRLKLTWAARKAAGGARLIAELTEKSRQTAFLRWMRPGCWFDIAA